MRKKWFRTNRESLLYGGFLILASGIAVLWLNLSRPLIKERTDLAFISGPFNEYSWVSKGRGSSLTFSLQNINNRFKIKADFFSFLDSEGFKSITYGEIITIAIPRVFMKNLNTGDRLFVYSVSSERKNYMDYEDAIRKHNSSFIRIAAGFFILMGLVALYFGFRWKIKEPTL